MIAGHGRKQDLIIEALFIENNESSLNGSLDTLARLRWIVVAKCLEQLVDLIARHVLVVVGSLGLLRFRLRGRRDGCGILGGTDYILMSSFLEIVGGAGGGGAWAILLAIIQEEETVVVGIFLVVDDVVLPRRRTRRCGKNDSGVLLLLAGAGRRGGWNWLVLHDGDERLKRVKGALTRVVALLCCDALSFVSVCWFRFSLSLRCHFSGANFWRGARTGVKNYSGIPRNSNSKFCRKTRLSTLSLLFYPQLQFL